MGRAFEGRNEVETPASPEQVWEAIATGPGIDSWFMGHNQVEPGDDGTVKMIFGGYTPEYAVTAWEPLKRFAYRSPDEDDGRFLAYEFLIEGREGGSAVVRMVVSGFLPGDDWEAEYDAMTKGGELFFRTLIEYLKYFPGRTASPITAFGPPVAEWAHAWTVLHRELGLTGPVTEGDQVRFTPDGLAPIEAVVYFVNPHTLGLRANDSMYRFLRGFRGGFVVAHHIFSDEVDQRESERHWQTWLTRLFA